MFFLLAIAIVIFVPDPWNWIGFFVAIVLGCFEVLFWQRRVRGKQRVVGAQTLIGRQAVVVTPCEPVGRVQIDAETWSAVCETGAGEGTLVQVIGRRGLQLVVSPVGAPEHVSVTRQE
jgi:membrane protein implicated in regulation of membrane protease activity